MNQIKKSLKRLTLRMMGIVSITIIAFIIAYAWGATAHHFINRRAVRHLPISMNSWKADSAYYDLHATDADVRRDNSDTTFGAEQWRHYIDIDAYPDFHNLPHDIDSVMTLYGYQMVKTTGMTPWAIGWVMDSLTAQLARGDITDAKQSAADIGHYVADGHQPLHCTKYYNGRFSNSEGIHSRYETTMINSFISQISINPDSVHYVESPVDFAFAYILQANSYVDSVYDADTYAKTASGWNGSGSAPSSYYDFLWERTQGFTKLQFQRATVDLACLWYTAFVNASIPKFTAAPESLNLGTVLIGDTRMDSITISNPGTSTLVIDSATSSSSEFSITPTAGNISPSSGMKFYITFGPENVGTRTGTVTIAHNAAGSPKTISVRGIGGLTSVEVSLDARWNLISNPLTTDDDSVLQLFPASLFPYAYSFSRDSGYSQRTQLKNGTGYWEKFPSGQNNTIMGVRRTIDSIDVEAGWNLIGSISAPVPTSSITPAGTTILSSYYEYNKGYHASDIITPGKGYWIKVSTSGTLILSSAVTAPAPIKSSGTAHNNFNHLIIEDVSGNTQTLYFGYTEESGDLYRYEMPPIPPLGIFDARFASGKSVAIAAQSNDGDFPIAISSASYPLTVRWEIFQQKLPATLLVDGQESQLQSRGETHISNPKSQIQLRLSSAGQTELPTVSALHQNYPNPFNPVTNFQFTIGNLQFVSLKVFDVLGREIATLVNEVKQPGSYEVQWDASNVSGGISAKGGYASGVYFYRLQTNGFTATKKLVLMK